MPESSVADDSDPLCTVAPQSATPIHHSAPSKHHGIFDLQGHRGARGLRPENTLPAFAAALQLGVRTLELDVGVTADDVVVVTHDRAVSPLKCRDTAPVIARDPDFPYVGKPIRALTLAQLKTLDLGRRHPIDAGSDPFVATQRPSPGAEIATLAEVFELAWWYGADEVRFNIETKIDPRHPGQTLDPENFAVRVLEVVEAYGMTHRAALQSFDWRTLGVARRVLPALGRVALTERRTTRPAWLAGLDLDAFDGDIAAAAAAIGAAVLSPQHEFLDSGMLASARWRGLGVIPWTVNEPDRMRRLVDVGVDGLITDYPDRLGRVLAERGRALPVAYAAPQTEPVAYAAPQTELAGSAA